MIMIKNERDIPYRQIGYCNNCLFVTLDLTMNGREYCPQCNIAIIKPMKINTNSTNMHTIRKAVQEKIQKLGLVNSGNIEGGIKENEG